MNVNVKEIGVIAVGLAVFLVLLALCAKHLRRQWRQRNIEKRAIEQYYAYHYRNLDHTSSFLENSSLLSPSGK
jgi:hypothetical protein